MFLNLFITIFAIIKLSKSADILGIYPTPSVSHQIVFQALTKDLLSHGHNLTMLTPNPLKINHPNLTEIDLSDSYENFQKRFGYGMVKDYRNNVFGFLRTAFQIFVEVIEDQMNCPDMKKFMSELDKYKFDVMIIEHTGHFPFLAFSEIFNVSVIGITSFETSNFVYQTFGSGGNIFANVEQAFPYIANEMTFSQRWENIKAIFMAAVAVLTPPFPFTAYGEVMQKHFPGVTKSSFELIEKVELLLVNVHPAVGFVRPLVPTTVQLGFMHVQPPKPLEDGPVKKFLDSSINGVIYMSFGTNIRSRDLEPEVINLFINVFKDLDYDVLWKFEDDNLPNKPKNVMIQKWLPQADLLAHPKVKLFITQCGHQSSEEAIDRAVPMILIPFFADQPGLAVKLQSKGVGRFIDFDDLNEKILKETIEEVLKPQYKENALKLKEVVYDQPMSSREKAVWWIEYFIRHKGVKHLDYPGRLVPFYKLYALDFFAVGIIIIYVSIRLLKICIKLFKGTEKAKSD